MASLLEKVHGVLAAGAVGDALGAPVEAWNWMDIRAKRGRIETFLDFDAGYARGPGHMTDDSYFRHLLCLAIVTRNGRITPDDFAEVLVEKMNPRRLWVNEHIMLAKLRQGMNPWSETGRGAIPSGCASMAIAPIGIINAGDPRQAYQDAFCIAGINEEGNNRDFAATFAAGVAAAFLPGANEGTVLDTMLRHSDYLSRRALLLALDLAGSSGDVEEFVARMYDSALMDWSWPNRGWSLENNRNFSGNSIDFLPVVAGLLKLCSGDPNRAIIEGANFGRDCDTIASCVGNVVGALYGVKAIRAEWVDACETANQDVFEELLGGVEQGFGYMAERLVAALAAERERSAARTTALQALLDG